MIRMSEGLILGCLVSGFGVTSILVFNKLSDMEISLSQGLVTAFELYKSQIIILLSTLILVLLAVFLFQRRSYKKEKIPLNCTKKVSVEEYERTKSRLTNEAVKKLVESEAYKKYVEDKNGNRLREIELNESDRIVLSDDSSADGEEEKDFRRQ